MANYMQEVAKMLGVELGKEFEIKELPHIRCKFYNDDVLISYFDPNCECCIPSVHTILVRLIAGKYTVNKRWKPHLEEKYYSVGSSGVIEPGCWVDDFIDIALYKLGNCYPTTEEAEANIDKWISFYASDEILEV